VSTFPRDSLSYLTSKWNRVLSDWFSKKYDRADCGGMGSVAKSSRSSSTSCGAVLEERRRWTVVKFGAVGSSVALEDDRRDRAARIAYAYSGSVAPVETGEPRVRRPETALRRSIYRLFGGKWPLSGLELVDEASLLDVQRTAVALEDYRRDRAARGAAWESPRSERSERAGPWRWVGRSSGARAVEGRRARTRAAAPAGDRRRTTSGGGRGGGPVASRAVLEPTARTSPVARPGLPPSRLPSTKCADGRRGAVPPETGRGVESGR
jgi:hypothetical protein